MGLEVRIISALWESSDQKRSRLSLWGAGFVSDKSFVKNHWAVHNDFCNFSIVYYIAIHSLKICSLVENMCSDTQSCPTLCDPTGCSQPGSSVHGILQKRILECVVISFSRGSSWPRDQIQVSHIAGRHFNLWATKESNHRPKVEWWWPTGQWWKMENFV